MNRRHAATRILLGFLIAAAAAQAQSNWVQQSPMTVPPARAGISMAYDAQRQQMVMFGGAVGGGFLSDTWTWDGNNWTPHSPTTIPNTRAQYCMAYDQLHQQIVMFGGGDGAGNFLNDTWTWDGSDWTHQSPSASPSVRINCGITYDEANSEVLLFGGTGLAGVRPSDTWVWDGSTWTQKDPATVPQSVAGYAGPAYDAARHQVVLIGFQGTGTSTYLNTTWTWDGTNWTQQTPATNLSPRVDFNVSYDSALQATIVFGGYNVIANTPGLRDTWMWNGANWAQLTTTTSPPGVESEAMGYDAASQQLVLFGGVSGAVLAQTWTLDAVTQPVTITVPGGTQFTFNGATYTGSQTINIVAGNYTLATTSPQMTAPGTQEVFLSWSDSGAQSHTVNVASAPVSVVGIFQTQYLLTTVASPSNGGTLTPAAPGAYYDAGAQPTVSAVPASGYSFTGWGGACTGTTPCTVTMNAPATVTGDFALQGTQVKINVPAGVSFSFGGTSYTGSQSLQVPSGPYSLTITSPQSTGPGTQAVFLSWSDGGTESHTVNVASTALNITGSFKTQYLLTTAASPAVGGTVSPPTGYVDHGTLVTVTETPAAGYAFANWSGACAGLSACSVTMNAPAAVTAVFSVIHVEVTINVPAGIQFSLAGLPFTGSRSFSLTEGPYVLSTLSPQSTGTGSQAAFVSWSDGGAQSHGVVVGAAAITITGTFKTQYQLTAVASPAGSGSFSLTPASPGLFYDASTPVVLQATANPGYVFEYFSGACSGSNSFCLILMTGPQSVVANFTVPLDWVELFPASTPSVRDSHSMAFDSVRNQMVLFGGETQKPSKVFGDTWVWDGSNWSLRAPLTSPGARTNAAMTFDARNQRIVLFSGLEATNSLGFAGTDTWLWDGTNWTEKTPEFNAPGPSGRYGHALVFDQTNNEVMLFGGSAAVLLAPPTPNDTWVWDGASWKVKTPQTSPSARSGHVMVYDQARHRVLLFGGQDSGYNLLSDTWEWDGTNWTLLTPQNSPPPRYAASMVFDARIQKVVLNGGSGTGGLLNDTWLWDGTNWTQSFPVNSPPARALAAMDYDSLHQEPVLFGGVVLSSEQDLGDTWIYLPPSVNVVSQGVSSVKDASGNILVTVTLTNAGNIPLTDILVLSAKLGNTAAASFTTPQLIAGVAPGAQVSFTAKFPPTAVGGLLSSAVAFSGSYSAGPTVGAPWTVSIRQSPVP